MGGVTDIVCTALTTVMTVLCVVAAGSFAMSTGIVRRDALRGVGYILASLSLPCLLITTLGSQLTPDMLANDGAHGVAVAVAQLCLRLGLALLGTVPLPGFEASVVDPSFRELILMACTSQNGVAHPVSMWRALAAVIGADTTVRRQTETLLFVSSIISGFSLWSLGYVTLARAVEVQRASEPVEVISESEDLCTPIAGVDEREEEKRTAENAGGAEPRGSTGADGQDTQCDGLSTAQCQVGIILGDPTSTRLGELFDSECWDPFSNAVCAMASRLPVPSWTRLLLTPPMISCAVGIAVGLTPLRQVIVSEAWPLRPIVQGAVVFGDLNIPLTMMLLGAILLPAPADSTDPAPSAIDQVQASQSSLKDRVAAFMMRSHVRFVAYVCAVNLFIIPLVTYLGFRAFAAIVASSDHRSVGGDGVLPWLPPQHRNVFIASMLEGMSPSAAQGAVICRGPVRRQHGDVGRVGVAVPVVVNVD